MVFWDFTIGDLITICLVPVGIAGGYYIHKWLKSPVQIIQEHNQESAYRSLFHIVNEFDYSFEHFFNSFHAYFGSIVKLERRFLPLSSKINITTTDSKGTKQETKIITFDEFKTDTFDPMFQMMKDRINELRDVIKITNNLVSIKLCNLLTQYAEQTIRYVEFFEKGEHTKTTLQIRYDYANTILNEINESNIINQFSSSEIKTFVKKWTDYGNGNP